MSRPLADVDSLRAARKAWRRWEDCAPEEQARAAQRWAPARAGLPGTPRSPTSPGCDDHVEAVWVTEADGTIWCPLCSDDLEAFAGVVVRWVRDHQGDGLVTTWDVAAGLGVRRNALGRLLRWLERGGHVARDGYAPARWVDGSEDSVCVWRAP